MKNVSAFSRVFFVVVLSVLVAQCTKDDTLKNINSIKMNGKNFPIVSASMMGVSIGDQGHTGIILTSGSFTQVKSLSIDVESFTQATIVGEYKFPEVSGKKKLDDWLTNYTVFDGSKMNSSNLKSGVVAITHNGGSNYTIDMNLTMDDGTTFTGKYKGEFQVMFNNQ
jgi:hypothetical protein